MIKQQLVITLFFYLWSRGKFIQVHTNVRGRKFDYFLRIWVDVACFVNPLLSFPLVSRGGYRLLSGRVLILDPVAFLRFFLSRPPFCLFTVILNCLAFQLTFHSSESVFYTY